MKRKIGDREGETAMEVVEERDALATEAPYAPVTYDRPVIKDNLEDHLPKPCKSFYLYLYTYIYIYI